MADRIQQRRDTAERWETFNPILLEGEVGYVTDNPNQYKIGDGIHAWNDLPLRGYTGTISQETGDDENAVISQKVVTEKLTELAREVIYDVSANNGGATFPSLSALLSSENLSTLIPIAVRCGGMNIRFVQSSDNKYIQARCMAQNFTTDVTQWQGVDDEPTDNSQNIVKSGGVKAKMNFVDLQINNADFSASAKQWGEFIILSDISLSAIQRLRIDVYNSIDHTESSQIIVCDATGAEILTKNTVAVDTTHRYAYYEPQAAVTNYTIKYYHKGNADSTVHIVVQLEDIVTNGKCDIFSSLQNEKLKVLDIKTIGYTGSGYAKGDYYLAGYDGKPRLVTSISGTGSVTGYIEYEKETSLLFRYNNALYSYNSDGNIQEVGGNYVKLYGLYDTPASPIIGTYYVSSGNQLRLIQSLYNGRPYTWIVVPFDSRTIYNYLDDFYYWNGSSLVKTGSKIVELIGLFNTPASANIGDYYINESGELKYISSNNSVANGVGDARVIYVYNNKIYRYKVIGQSHQTGNNVNWFVAEDDIVTLSGFGNPPTTPKVGDYYYNGINLRIITKTNVAGTLVSDYVNIDFSTNALYLYKNRYYKYNGSTLVLLDSPQLNYMKISTIPFFVNGDMKKMVLCGVLYNNSKTPLENYSQNSHALPIAWLYYDKTTQDAIYIARYKADNIVKLFDWNTGVTELTPVHYSFAITPDLDVICVPRGELLLNRDNSPIIYQHQDYTQPVLLNVQKQNSAGVLVKPTGWFGNAGLNVNYSDGTILFAEYVREQTEPANIWKVEAPYTNTDDWSIVYASVGTGEGTREIEHFHAINYDFYTGRLYAVSGDSASESKIYESTDGGDNWSVIYGGTSEDTRIVARSLNWVFTKEGAFYGSDQGPLLIHIPRDNNGILDFTSNKIITDIQNMQYVVAQGQTSYEVYYTCLVDNPYGVLLLGYQQAGNSNPLPIYFYDIKNNVFTLAGLSYPLLNSEGTAYNPNGFRCDAVSFYQSLLEKRFVCGFGNINPYIGVAGNNGSDVGNISLEL